MAKITKMLVGESLVGDGNEVAHIDLIIGPRGTPAETAFANALTNNNSSIIEYLIKSDPMLNENRGALLRSLSRSNPNDSGYVFYKLPFNEQAAYDWGKGRASGYVWALNSIARRKTTSSTVIKSGTDTLDESFVLVALGNPLFSPYIPIKISDFEVISSYQNEFNSIISEKNSLSYLANITSLVPKIKFNSNELLIIDYIENNNIKDKNYQIQLRQFVDFHYLEYTLAP